MTIAPNEIYFNLQDFIESYPPINRTYSLLSFSGSISIRFGEEGASERAPVPSPGPAPIQHAFFNGDSEIGVLISSALEKEGFKSGYCAVKLD
ncbi:uncharacterized protein ARMOST_02031 [Armillaria ostoyae]|uniref:Uncharacterized protein n=1 Tax=Armillaria ostoyae TaxID=47428 RepID=A0A284QQK3_ARMOS|nr:uncharacterized protein ARMOST_02031 [Armillaria ostoyae]